MTTTLIALALLLGQPLGGPGPLHCPGPCKEEIRLVRVADTGEQGDLHKQLMGKYLSMNAKHEGIFHENITPTVEKYFPVGQPIAETKKIIAEQHLGELKPYMGKPMADEGSPFATTFHVTDKNFTEVAVVLHIGFSGHDESDFKVKTVHAFLRGTGM